MFVDGEGPTHRYMLSTPGCWAAYGEVLARQYSDSSYAPAGQLTVDAYAVQHPGLPSPQSIRSVALHLISLCRIIEHGKATVAAAQAIAAAANERRAFIWLTPPRHVGEITIAEVRVATTGAEHVQLVRRWAECAWRAWSDHHGAVRSWAANNE
jgi:hypothetical protein